eukprot:s2507_g7.t1
MAENHDLRSAFYWWSEVRLLELSGVGTMFSDENGTVSGAKNPALSHCVPMDDVWKRSRWRLGVGNHVLVSTLLMLPCEVVQVSSTTLLMLRYDVVQATSTTLLMLPYDVVQALLALQNGIWCSMQASVESRCTEFPPVRKPEWQTVRLLCSVVVDGAEKGAEHFEALMPRRPDHSGE